MIRHDPLIPGYAGALRLLMCEECGQIYPRAIAHLLAKHITPPDGMLEAMPLICPPCIDRQAATLEGGPRIIREARARLFHANLTLAAACG